MKVKKICLMADVLRCKDGVDGIFFWLTGIMSGIISRITDVPLHFYKKEELKELHESIYKCFGHSMERNDLKYNFLSVPVDAWKEVSLADPNKEVLDIIKKNFADSLIICREPSKIIKKSLDVLNIPYVDLALHSIRYMDDLIMGATSNFPEIYDKIKKYETSDENFYFHADLIKSESLFRQGLFNNITKGKKTALFLAQTPVDISLLNYKDKKIATLSDYKEEFEKIVKEYELVYYKPHPFYVSDEDIKYVKQFDNVEILGNNVNTYALLSLPQLELCASISSGTLKEAHYFGKKTVCFLDQPYHYSEEVLDKSKLNKDIFITIGKEWFTAHFWSDILSPIIETKKVTHVDVSNIHNKFRRILGTSWGYKDSDSTWVDKEIINLNNKLIKKSSSRKIYFFGIPIINIKEKKDKKTFNFLGLPIIKTKNNKKIYFLGLPILKVKHYEK